MRKLIKGVLPKSVARAAIRMRDGVRLARTPRQSLSAANLMTLSGLPLDEIFSDSAMESSWNNDHEIIKGIFSDAAWRGGISIGDRRALYYMLSALKPQNVLEVGTHIGASTLYIARVLRNLGRGKVVTVDILDVNKPDGPWSQAGLSLPPAGMADAIECRDCIDFRTSPSLNFMESTQERFDFIFLDGDHASRAVYQELGACLPILKSSGLILLHDYYPDAKPLFPSGRVIHGPFRALERIRRETDEFHVHPLGNLPWKTKQGVNMTSLAVVTRNDGA